MFNLSGSEIVVILLLALVVLGPEKLPDAIRRFGKMYSELRRMSTSFQDELRSTLDEPMREMRETADLLREQADFTRLDDRGPRHPTPGDEKPKSAEMAPVVDDEPDDAEGLDVDEADGGGADDVDVPSVTDAIEDTDSRREGDDAHRDNRDDGDGGDDASGPEASA